MRVCLYRLALENNRMKFPERSARLSLVRTAWQWRPVTANPYVLHVVRRAIFGKLQQDCEVSSDERNAFVGKAGID